MRLEKLVVQGFKSFADRTEFIFQPGLTAFVGPNGCGKSNVVDAVKWVLGEQSVKSLRGNEMQDVIFNGTPTRRSLGYAEVTLTFSNTKGMLPTDYETVSVTRRLYRSGESEYYLNKQRCRLRDIRDLFMDTGIGMDAYSIIEQGKVDVLLSGNAQGRRAILEEAAGISKYKAQKKICLSKLERVASNLVRLGDIIDEVEKRSRSLKYQAAKARRWQRLEEQRRELSIALALHQYDLLVKDRDATVEELRKLEGENGTLHAAIERMEAELAELETALIEADQNTARLESEEVRIASALLAAEEAIKVNEQHLAEIDGYEDAAKAEIAKTEAALELMRKELEQDTGLVGDLEQTVAAGQEQLAQRRSVIREIENRLRALRGQIDETRVQVVDLANERAKYNNELSALAAQRNQLVRQDARLAARAQEHRANLTQCVERQQEFARQTTEISGRCTALEEERAEIERQHQACARTIRELAERAAAKRTDLAAVVSRRELLQDLEDRSEGVGAGVRCLIEARNAGDPAAMGICGVLADLIDVDIEHARAIEAALAPHEQLIVTESFEATTNAIDFLVQNEKGKASFLSLDAVNGQPLIPPEPPTDPAVIGRATNLVRHHESFSKLIQYLLGDVLVVRDIGDAKRLAVTNGHSTRYAALDGQVLNRNGVSSGGAARGVAGVISRRSELRSLDARQASIEADIAVLSREQTAAAELSAQLKGRLEELTQAIASARAELAEVQAEIGKVEALAHRLESEVAAAESEQSEITANIELLARRETEVCEIATRIEQSESERKATLTELERLLGESETSRDLAKAQATELEVALAQQVEKVNSLRRRLGELNRLISENEIAHKTAHEQLVNCGRRRTAAHEAILAKKREIGELLERRGKLGMERAEAANRRELIRVQLASKREERNNVSRNVRDSDSRLNKLNVHATEISMRIENLEDRIRGEFGCSLAERYRHGAADERDWTAVAAEIEDLDRKLRELGAVNTYAIAELDELEKRAQELQSQRDDLLKAQETLKEIIRRINRKSRDMFVSTFGQVRENFQVLFRKLFGGGRADMILEQDVDILDAGVDIIACPPGKEPASISLLSGGEKTLTAIALLFAIFRSKPSPFCILDEVDAALDESNIDRFAMLVREFLKDSQFIVVTHSRRTMALADALYGITMQEPGVSTRVAVKFEDDADVAAAG